MNENEWIKKADDDLKAAEILFQSEDPPTWIICFHCQQTAEKYLKAYLIASDIEFKELHDLMYLFGLCFNIDAEFETLREDLKMLNPYAVTARYPFDNMREYTIEDSREAIDRAKRVKKLISVKLLK